MYLLQSEDDLSTDSRGGSHGTTCTIAAFASEAVALEAARAIAVRWDDSPPASNDSLPDFRVSRLLCHRGAHPFPPFSLQDNTTTIWSYQGTWKTTLPLRSFTSPDNAIQQPPPPLVHEQHEERVGMEEDCCEENEDEDEECESNQASSDYDSDELDSDAAEEGSDADPNGQCTQSLNRLYFLLRCRTLKQKWADFFCLLCMCVEVDPSNILTTHRRTYRMPVNYAAMNEEDSSDDDSSSSPFRA